MCRVPHRPLLFLLLPSLSSSDTDRLLTIKFSFVLHNWIMLGGLGKQTLLSPIDYLLFLPLILFISSLSSSSSCASAWIMSDRLGTSTTATTTTTTTPLEEILAGHANSYASAHGIQVERRRRQEQQQQRQSTDDVDHDKDDQKRSYFECAPMSLLPNAYPKQAFQQAQSLATVWNVLVDRISRDGTFLQQTLQEVVEADPYTAKLLQLYQQVYNGNGSHQFGPDGNDHPSKSFADQADRLGIHRSDYMLHQRSSSTSSYQLKQVELNTIAASFAGLSVKVAKLHQYLTSRFQTDVEGFLQQNKQTITNQDHNSVSSSSSSSSSLENQSDGVPDNPALERIPQAMAVAFSRYAQRFHSSSTTTTTTTTKSLPLGIVFIVQDGETNTVDQRTLEFALWEQYQIPVLRISLTRAAKEMTVDPTTGALSLQGYEIAVVYYRAGYAPTDYPDGDDGVEWQARLIIENSRATKCPSLGYHLAGTKKVQQELARPGMLERFFPKPEESTMVEMMRSAFAGLYSLGEDATEEDLQAVQAVLDGHQGGYVLKPQREGGGYNFYGDKLAQKIKDHTTKDESSGKLVLGKVLAEYILMERLFPPQQRAILLRGGRVEGSGDSVSELGCYGTVVVTPDGTIVHNDYAGFLLRTKFSNVDEGGVASGFATLSSPYLC